MPSSQSVALTRSDNLSSSQTNLASPTNQPYHGTFYQTQHSITPVSPGITSNVPSGSPASFSYETSQDVLLQEITTLRERLATLESENATMTAKLNQQQWDVENRLSELEMHMCPSSSMASTTSQDDRQDRLEPVNRESIIWWNSDDGCSLKRIHTSHMIMAVMFFFKMTILLDFLVFFYRMYICYTRILMLNMLDYLVVLS